MVANRGQHFYSAIWKGQMRPIHASPSCEIAGAKQMLPWSHKDRIFVISDLAHSLQGDPLTVNSCFAKFTKREDGLLSYVHALQPREPPVLPGQPRRFVHALPVHHASSAEQHGAGASPTGQEE